jgi:hypothetical protein
MKRSHRNVLLFAGVALAGYFLTSAFASSMGSPTTRERTPEQPDSGAGVPAPDGEYSTGPAPPEPGSPPATGDEVSPPADGTESGKTRTYAIALHELPGLPPDAEAGTRLDVWAVWRPPLTKDRQVQKLVEGVSLERITPPLTPEGPPVAILRVPEREVDELLFGDRFGELSAAVIP